MRLRVFLAALVALAGLAGMTGASAASGAYVSAHRVTTKAQPKPSPTPTPTPSPSPSVSPSVSPTAPAVAAPGFVTHAGATLTLDGQPFRYAGTNVYELGLSESSSPWSAGGVHLPAHAEIDAVLADAQTMGANVVRTFGALSVGCPLCIEPSLGVFNSANYDSLDYAVSVAKAKRIRLMMPLVHQDDWYHGSKWTYLRWRGIRADRVASQFFTNTTVLADYKQHIADVLNHVNPYTGLAYKDDPTIMAWETGNELAVYPNAWTYSGWTDSVASYIKSIDPQHLVFDGHYTIYTSGTTPDVGSLSLASLDGGSDHAYDQYRDPASLKREADLAHSYGKAFFVGEYSPTDKDVNGRALPWTLDQQIAGFEANGIDDLWWNLKAGGTSGDPFTLHWPGDTSDMTGRLQKLQAHAFRVCPAGAACRS